mmetsp:Transcript_58586/g.174421  ORF Transcript_58586/g.174421 Transcript_58586/m.174421 type:complete len:121 (-) Transcript_58586:649-1011(-)
MTREAEKLGPEMVSAAKGVKLGLRSHPINDGRKYDGFVTWIYNRNKGTHCKIIEESADLTTKLLLAVLRYDKFAAIYGAKVHLTPVMDCSLMSKQRRGSGGDMPSTTNPAEYQDQVPWRH